MSERVLEQPAGDDELGDRHAARVERLDDHAGAERGGLEQRAVDLLGAGREGLADDDAGELVVDEHRAVAVVPVEGDQAVRADRLRRRPGRSGTRGCSCPAAAAAST